VGKLEIDLSVSYQKGDPVFLVTQNTILIFKKFWLKTRGGDCDVFYRFKGLLAICIPSDTSQSIRETGRFLRIQCDHGSV